MNTDTVIRKVQELVNVTVDGRAGPQTWQAIFERIAGKALPKTALFVGKVDERSEKTIATLHPQVAPHARSLVQRAASVGIEIKIIGGTRTFAEQDALFAQGRTKPGRRVTNAKGGESNHNFGIAFDIGVFNGKTYLGESPSYDVVGALGMDLGLEWGGAWTTLVDKPHYQLRPVWADHLSEREMLAELRERVAQGKDVYA
ncbi:M15 family metallopeptidase [Rhodoferax sp. WC2427]|uniref:M15 family metallopeptidase n=1 Tax=Rhodoferax sp. WC2427 TaxID=3234144 RepID=UPI0034654995